MDEHREKASVYSWLEMKARRCSLLQQHNFVIYADKRTVFYLKHSPGAAQKRNTDGGEEETADFTSLGYEVTEG